MAAFAIVMIVIGAIFFTSPAYGGMSGINAVFLFAGVVLLIEIAWIVWRAPTRCWRRNTWIRGPQRLAFSDEGIETQSTVSEGRSQWALLKGSYENTSCYMLLTSGRASYMILPKRAFTSPQDVARFRQLLERHTEAHLWSRDHM